MRPAFAYFSPTVPAAFAAGIGISLSVFLLPSGVAQKGPTPVLPAFGGTAGRVVADLPVAHRRAPLVREAAAAQPHLVVVLRPPATKARQVHHRARTVVVRREPPASVPGVAPTTRTTPVTATEPVTTTELFSIPRRGKGKARGHDRGHGPKPKAATRAPLPPGRGKALGHSNEHQDRLPPGLAKKAPPESAPGASPPPKGNGDGNGGRGNGDANGGKGDDGGNGRKGEKN